jgi:uncharacterized protein
MTRPLVSPDHRQRLISSGILLAILAGLLAYKSSAGSMAIREAGYNGTLQRDVQGLLLAPAGHSIAEDVIRRSITYLALVAPALAFGLLISGAVATGVSPRWLVRTLEGAPWRQHVVAGVAGTPLMLCSCCISPVFSAVLARSRRLGPALAVALASPSLNPVALLLTFMLFRPAIGFTRVAMGIVAVFVIAPAVGTLGQSLADDYSACARAPRAGTSSVVAFLLASINAMAKSVPVVVVGVMVSMWLSRALAMPILVPQTMRIAVVGIAAFTAVPIALPTFFEIPLALSLSGPSVPAGVATAILFAGPAINLPSLITIGRSSHWSISAGLAVAIGLLAWLGGVLVG